VAHDRVERFSGDEILRQVGRDPAHASRNRRRDGRMRDVGRNQRFELGHELMDTLRRQIQLEELDGDEATLLRLVRTKHRPQRACADLMKYTKRAESVRRRRADSVRIQRGCSSGKAA
jgi:hypothetical protein